MEVGRLGRPVVGGLGQAATVDRDPARGLDGVREHGLVAREGDALAAPLPAALATCFTKRSSSVSRIGLSDTTVAPADVNSASTRSGGGSRGSSIA